MAWCLLATWLCLLVQLPWGPGQQPQLSLAGLCPLLLSPQSLVTLQLTDWWLLLTCQVGLPSPHAPQGGCTTW